MFYRFLTDEEIGPELLTARQHYLARAKEVRQKLLTNLGKTNDVSRL